MNHGQTDCHQREISMSRKILGLTTIFALLIGGGVSGHAQTKPVRFATGVDASFMQLVVAVEKGFMKKHGLQAEYKPFPFGLLALEAVVAGEADVAMAAETAVLRPKAKGAKYTAVARPVYSKELIGVAAVKGVDGPKDFAGKKIGYPKGSAGDYYMNLYFKRNGLDPKAMTLVNVAPPELVSAISRGDIQVMFAWEPWFVRLKSVVKDAHVIEKSGDHGIYTMQYLLNFSDAFLKDRRDEARRTLLALIDATDWLNDPKNRDEATSLLSKAYRVPAEDAPRQLKEIVYTMDLTQEFIADVRRAGDWLKEQGIITVDSPTKLVDDLINPELLLSVARNRVEVR
jgi:taurine transport system substrate-binding protein